MKTSIESFLHRFLLEERALHARFARAEQLLWVKFAVPGTHKHESVEWLTEWDKRTTLESAKVDGDRAAAIVTVRRHEHWLRRARYVVSKVNGELRVSDLRYFCIICRGSGISARGGVCDICEGEGYFASPELNRVASQDESQSTHLRGETPSPEELDQFMHEFLGANRQLYGQLNGRRVFGQVLPCLE